MGKSTPIVIRSHAQEREWLLRLGNGNIVAGVRSLIQQAQSEPTLPIKQKNKKRGNHSTVPISS